MRTNAILVPVLAIGAVLLTAGAPPVAAGPPRDRDGFHVTVAAGKGRLGVSVLEISPELRAHLGAPADHGVLVNTVAPLSPAARAGLRVGDVIVSVDGADSDSAWNIIEAMSDRKKGDTVALSVVRDRKTTSLRATLDDDPAPAAAMKPLRDLTGRFDMDRFFGPDRDDLEKRLEALERRLDRLDRKR